MLRSLKTEDQGAPAAVLTVRKRSSVILPTFPDSGAVKRCARCIRHCSERLQWVSVKEGPVRSHLRLLLYKTLKGSEERACGSGGGVVLSMQPGAYVKGSELSCQTRLCASITGCIVLSLSSPHSCALSHRCTFSLTKCWDWWADGWGRRPHPSVIHQYTSQKWSFTLCSYPSFSWRVKALRSPRLWSC